MVSLPVSLASSEFVLVNRTCSIIEALDALCQIWEYTFGELFKQNIKTFQRALRPIFRWFLAIFGENYIDLICSSNLLYNGFISEGLHLWIPQFLAILSKLR